MSSSHKSTKKRQRDNDPYPATQEHNTITQNTYNSNNKKHQSETERNEIEDEEPLDPLLLELIRGDERPSWFHAIKDIGKDVGAGELGALVVGSERMVCGDGEEKKKGV